VILIAVVTDRVCVTHQVEPVHGHPFAVPIRTDQAINEALVRLRGSVTDKSIDLFGPEPVHLNSLYDRAEDRLHQWWTLPHVPGRRLGPDAPVFVLTSSRTYSAAEEFTYNLKNLGRATIVGETTGGGAHPVDSVRISDHLELRVPHARAINPISGTNWEGTGVAPDVAVRADQALLQAHVLAVEGLYEAETDRERRDALGTLYIELSDRLAQGR